MTKEAGFLHGEAIHQRRPLHFAGQTGHQLFVVGVVTGAAYFPHADIEAGFEKGFALDGQLHAGAIFEQTSPACELFVVQLGFLKTPSFCWH